MSEIATPLTHVLEATGYLANGEPTPSVHLGKDAQRARGLPSLQPDARWHNRADNLNVYFKYSDRKPDNAEIARWHQDVWNEGTSPLLWVIHPESVEIYNGFGAPREPDMIQQVRLMACSPKPFELAALDDYAGRLVMETGQFWREETRVNRRNAVDRRLLGHLRALQDRLIERGLTVSAAQGLIGRSIFAKYLVDRGIITERRLETAFGHSTLERVLRDRSATEALFAWLRDTFNGDMFPPGEQAVPEAGQLDWVARFLEGENPQSRQSSFFPYQFNVIPVELISAIYEQFVHSRDASGEPTDSSAGVHYTPASVVSLILDEVMQGLTGHEQVLDITCGSGIFLVEALRRLVRIKAGDMPPTRSMIRETLYTQIHGIDISEPAIRVAAFSLVLAALELDPDPIPSRSLRFKALQDNSLFVGNAYDIETTEAGGKLVTKDGLRTFDLIVGNPPWGKDSSHKVATGPPLDGATSLRYLGRAKAFAHEKTRFGMVLSATAFFPRTKSRLAVAQRLVEALSPATLINLSSLSSRLFDKANMPAIALLARYRNQPSEEMELIQVEWSPAGAECRSIETLPSDISLLPIQSWRRNASLLKAGFCGTLHDQLLLDNPRIEHRTLEEQLGEVKVRFSEGLKRGSAHDATHLKGLRKLAGLHPFTVEIAGQFRDAKAERPRDRAVYEAPLLLVQEFMRPVRGGGRAVVAVARDDLVFGNAFNGASFPRQDVDLALLVAGILGSAFASWYFMMAASEFGIWKRRLLLADIRSLPAPDLRAAIASDSGMRILEAVNALEEGDSRHDVWHELDDAVLDLYALEGSDRLVVKDGLTRSSWQWGSGRISSVTHASEVQLGDYAKAFVEELDPWFLAANERRLRAKILDLPIFAPFRVVRFVLEEHSPPSVVEVVETTLAFNQLIAGLSERYSVDASKRLAEEGELRIVTTGEVLFIRPAARRHWLAVNALRDARRVLEESFRGVFE